MARRVSDELRACMARGGVWLRRQREKAGYATGTEFAEALGIKQVRLSTYERGQYAVEPEIARKIAQVLGLTELEVWRGLCMPLPREVRTDDEAIREMERRFPGKIAEILAGDSPPVRSRRDRPGETGRTA